MRESSSLLDNTWLNFSLNSTYSVIVLDSTYHYPILMSLPAESYSNPNEIMKTTFRYPSQSTQTKLH